MRTWHILFFSHIYACTTTTNYSVVRVTLWIANLVWRISSDLVHVGFFSNLDRPSWLVSTAHDMAFLTYISALLHFNHVIMSAGSWWDSSLNLVLQSVIARCLAISDYFHAWALTAICTKQFNYWDSCIWLRRKIGKTSILSYITTYNDLKCRCFIAQVCVV